MHLSNTSLRALKGLDRAVKDQILIVSSESSFLFLPIILAKETWKRSSTYCCQVEKLKSSNERRFEFILCFRRLTRQRVQITDISEVEQDPAYDVDVVKISVETPKTERCKPATLARDQEEDLKVVAMTVHFKNKISISKR